MMANAFYEDVEKSIATGMNGPLPKPMGIDTMAEMIGKNPRETTDHQFGFLVLGFLIRAGLSLLSMGRPPHRLIRKTCNKKSVEIVFRSPRFFYQLTFHRPAYTVFPVLPES